MKLHVRGFRILEDFQHDFQKQTTIIVGKNGIGKTTVMEALYYCCFLKSHRTNKIKELINFQKEYCHLQLVVDELQLEIHFSDSQQVLKVAGKEVRKQDFIGLFNVIMIDSEQMEIINGGPAKRRNFLNRHISQYDKSYLKATIKYQELSKIKNKYLLQRNINEVFLHTLNQQLLELDEMISKLRMEYLVELEKYVNLFISWITSDQEKVELKYLGKPYESGIETKEIQQKRSLWGATKAELDILLDEKSLKSFGSQGQKRTVMLALMIGHLEILQQKTGHYPLVLLDDIHSELDQVRQEKLHKLLMLKTNVIITTPELSTLAKVISENEQTEIIKM